MEGQIKLGAIQDTFEEYLGRIDCLSSSDISNLLDSPLAYHISKTKVEAKEKDHFVLGRAIHCAVIEPNEFLNRYQTFYIEMRPEADKGMTSKKNKAWKIEMLQSAKNNNFEYLSEKQQQDIHGRVRSVERNPDAIKLISDCTMFETSYYANVKFGERKYNLRCRPDMMGAKHYVSIKSTKSPTRDLFYKEIAKFNYQVKEAFYWMVLNATRRAMGMPELENGYIIAIGEHETFVYELNTNEMQGEGNVTPFINDGLHLCDIALKRYDKMQKTKIISGSEINYNNQFTYPIYNPAWKQNEIETLISQNQQ